MDSQTGISQFPVDRRGLQQTLLHEPFFGFYLDSLLEPPTEESFDIVRGQVGGFGVLEHHSQVLRRALVYLVVFDARNGGLENLWVTGWCARGSSR